MTTHRSGTSRATARRQGAPLIGVSEPTDDRELSPAAQFAWETARVLGLYVIVPVLLLSFGAAALGYVWLMHSPVPLKSFSKRIESRINASLSGFRADIDDAFLAIGADKGVELRLTNLRIKEADGDDVVSAPEAAVKFNKAALWRLDAVPERINLIQPKLAVVYSDANGFSLSIRKRGLIVPRHSPATDRTAPQVFIASTSRKCWPTHRSARGKATRRIPCSENSAYWTPP
jgi:hypothetical protein